MGKSHRRLENNYLLCFSIHGLLTSEITITSALGKILSTSFLDSFILVYIRKTRRRDAYIRDTILKTGLAANIGENVKVTIYI